MQGVFWAQMDLLNLIVGPTDLISFARTRHGRLSLFSPLFSRRLLTVGSGQEMGCRRVFFEQTKTVTTTLSDPLAIIHGPDHPMIQRTYSSRLLFVRSNGTSPSIDCSLSYYLTYFDVLYLFKLRDGTLESPTRFVITPSFKFFSSCFRINLGWATNCTYTILCMSPAQLSTPTHAFRAPKVLLRFEMDLILDPNNRYRRQYPNSVIWNRTTKWAGWLSLTYPAIQIIDGNGNPVEPAYSVWKQNTPSNFIVGLDPNRMDERLVC